MNQSSSESGSGRYFYRAFSRVAGVVLLIVVTICVNGVIAELTRFFGADRSFEPLHFAAYAPLTALGVLAATAGWLMIVRVGIRWRYVPAIIVAVVAVSLVPDIMVGVSKSMRGTTWTGVIGLITMHVAIAVLCVPLLCRMFPVRCADRMPE